MRFVEPPKTKAVMGKWSYDWIDVRNRLHEKPGEWLLLAEGGRASVASAIRQGKIKDFHPDDGYEITVRNTNTKDKPTTCDIFVRYDPEKKKETK